MVFPGHVGTDIVANSLRAHWREPERMSDAQVEELIPPAPRAGLTQAGMLPEGASADDLRQMLVRMNADFRDKAPLSAARAAAIILAGVRSGAWRILVGEDAAMIDAAVRAKPDASYDYAELFNATGQAPAAGTPVSPRITATASRAIPVSAGHVARACPVQTARSVSRSPKLGRALPSSLASREPRVRSG